MRLSKLQRVLSDLAAVAANIGAGDPEVVLVFASEMEARAVVEAWIRQPPGKKIQIAIEAGKRRPV
jgi:hypothetical protein